MAGLELILILARFHNTNTASIEDEDDLPIVNFNSFAVVAKYLRKPKLRNLLISLFALGVGGFIVNSSLSLYMNNIFGTSGIQFGYIFAIFGVITALNMALLLPKFWTKILSTKSLIVLAHAMAI